MRVIDAAVGAAWAMEEAALVTLLEVAAREHEITPEALAAYKAQALEKGERATFRDGVAILNMEGPLFKRANLMTEFCGATSYDVLMRDFTVALDDSNVRAILFNTDSPGGEASGCAEFAAFVAAARGRKPIVAYVGDQACSAAYWIASACDKIILSPTGTVGSLGVRCTLPDTSARDARSGVARHEFVSSQSPYKVNDPKTDDGRSRIQARVDALAEVFVQAVADNRDVSVAKVLDSFGKGDVRVAGAAIAAGMADGFGTFESVLSELSKSTDPLAALDLPSAAMRGSASSRTPSGLDATAYLRAHGIAVPSMRARPSDGDAAAALILEAFDLTRQEAPEGDAAVNAILAAFRTTSPN